MKAPLSSILFRGEILSSLDDDFRCRNLSVSLDFIKVFIEASTWELSLKVRV
jgi:hypothetical protein